MLFLTPVITPSLLDSITPADLPSSLSELEEQMEQVWAMAGDRNANVSITVASAEDELGRSYEEVGLVVTGRFKRDRERFLLSGDVAVSFDTMLEVLKYLFTHVKGA